MRLADLPIHHVQVSRELEAKAPSAELVRVIKMQQARAVPLDAGTARWIWRSGRTRSSAVPWNVEVLNTDPENFIWEQDKVCGHAVCLIWALYAK